MLKPYSYTPLSQGSIIYEMADGEMSKSESLSLRFYNNLFSTLLSDVFSCIDWFSFIKFSECNLGECFYVSCLVCISTLINTGLMDIF